MLTLQNLQQEFIKALKTNSNYFLTTIHPNPSLSPAHQFEIYKNSITGRFQRILMKTYPACLNLVGKDFFINMATIYINSTNSYTHDINTFGSDFNSFITTYSPATILPYLPDVAALEWAWHRLQLSPIPQPFDFEKLSTHLNKEIIFTLCPGSTLLTSPYPLHLIWEMNQSSNIQGESLILKDNETYYFYIWQSQNVLHIDVVDQTEWRVLNLISNLMPLSALCADIETASELFPLWIAKGWIAGFIF